MSEAKDDSTSMTTDEEPLISDDPTVSKVIAHVPVATDLMGDRPLSLEAYNHSGDQMFVTKIKHFDSTRQLTSKSSSSAVPQPPQVKFSPNNDLDILPEQPNPENSEYALEVGQGRRLSGEQDRRRSSLTSGRRSSGGSGSGRRGSIEDFNASDDQKFAKRITSFNSMGGSEFKAFLHTSATSSNPMETIQEPKSPQAASASSASQPPAVEIKSDAEMKSEMEDDFFSRIRRISRGRSTDSGSGGAPALSASASSTSGSSTNVPTSTVSTTDVLVPTSGDPVEPESDDPQFVRRVLKNSGRSQESPSSGSTPKTASASPSGGQSSAASGSSGTQGFVNKSNFLCLTLFLCGSQSNAMIQLQEKLFLLEGRETFSRNFLHLLNRNATPQLPSQKML
jgi:hypothetical protein